MIQIVGKSRGGRVTHKSILLVESNSDDEVLTVRTLRINLVMNEIIVAHDDTEALDYLFGTGHFQWRDSALQPQLILLDVKLPKMGALALLTRLRADNRTALQPVAFLTTPDDDLHDFMSRDLGPIGYIRKPVAAGQLIDVIQQFRLYCLLPAQDFKDSNE